MRKREKRERRKKERAIVDFIMVMNHFFHYLREWLLEMNPYVKELKRTIKNTSSKLPESQKGE